MLSKNRDMTLNEVKLILAIEDPRAQEARRVYGVEVSVVIKRPSGGGSVMCVFILLAVMTNLYHQIPNLLFVDFISALSELCIISFLFFLVFARFFFLLFAAFLFHVLTLFLSLVQNESGVSRDEIAECLIDVAERRKVNNRIALRELRKELAAWPGLLKSSEDAGGDEAESDGDLQATSGDLAKPAANPQIGRGEEDESGLPKALADYLPDWMGYGVLYSLSIVPILITLGALAILWVNSFSN